MSDHEPTRRVDAHFESRGASPRGEGWRQEVAASPAARSRFARWLLLARLDRRQASAEERIARSLGLVPPRRTAAQWAGALGLAAAVAVALLVVLPRTGDDGFQARGAGTPAVASELRVYRVTGGQASPLPPDGAFRRDDELAFAYRNPAGRAWLLVFAVDAAGQVYWFHPAWTDAAQDPVAVPARRSDDLVELPAATAHAWSTSPVTVYAWLSEQRRSVREVEALLSGTGAPAAPAGDVVLRQTLRLAKEAP